MERGGGASLLGQTVFAVLSPFQRIVGAGVGGVVATWKGYIGLRGVYRRLPAELTYRRLEGDERLSLVEVHPEEGRTHQIRALFAEAGRPLAGDLRYGKPKPARQFLEKFGLPCLLLHAAELELTRVVPGLPRTFTAPLPEEFRRLAEKKGWSTGPRGN